ncbi:MAG: terpene cyclase/mutase family protein [Planctomycetes bacterium]|nr:terpene cyclase/mutase family protein [Planctomycetota bacterium]
MFRSLSTAFLVVTVAATGLAPACQAASPSLSGDALAKARGQAVAKAVEFLRAKGQAADGSFTAPAGPAVTALVATAMLRSGRTPDDPTAAAALKYLDQFVQPDGGVFKPDTNHANYETCLALVCFIEANKDGRYNDRIAKAHKYIKSLQWDESEGHDPNNPAYGGAGYGKSKRPDLSNTSFFLDALKAAGDGPDDPAIKKALVFVSRCQNLESEANTTEFAAKNPDGGFYYTPAGGGNSQAGKTDEGGLRSYASMTYAGLKSMIYAGLTPNDPRVKAALEWLGKHYTLESNPGMADAGLYYYYTTFAKALDAMGQESFTDNQGGAHRWRDELANELIRRQREDGSWANENARWMEGDPNLVTGYALLALSYCQPTAKP